MDDMSAFNLLTTLWTKVKFSMLASILVLSVGLITLAIFWDVKKRQRQLKLSTVVQSTKNESNQIFAIFFAVFFAILGIWFFFDPPTPSFGAKGMLFHMAYLLIGKYGPSVMAFAVCLYSLWQLRLGNKKRSGM